MEQPLVDAWAVLSNGTIGEVFCFKRCSGLVTGIGPLPCKISSPRETLGFSENHHRERDMSTVVGSEAGRERGGSEAGSEREEAEVRHKRQGQRGTGER